MKITKRYSESIKFSDGTLKCFSTEIQGDEKVLDTPEAIIAESDKVFAQCKWLTNKDKNNELGLGE
jgi:hypothetical protein